MRLPCIEPAFNTMLTNFLLHLSKLNGFKRQNMKYKILHEYQLIVRYFNGHVDLSAFYNAIAQSTHDSDYNASYSGLYDIRDAQFAIDETSLRWLVEKVRSNQTFLTKRKLIFLTNQPNQVVFSSLLKKFSILGLYDLQVFSTLNAALNYLKLNDTDSEIVRQLLNTMRTN